MHDLSTIKELNDQAVRQHERAETVRARTSRGWAPRPLKAGESPARAGIHGPGEKGPRPLFAIALEITADWKKVYFGAVPYLRALAEMHDIQTPYYQDTGRSVVAYFLTNANTWRGPVARRVKAELNALLKATR